jgi:hypothetical protein
LIRRIDDAVVKRKKKTNIKTMRQCDIVLFILLLVYHYIILIHYIGKKPRHILYRKNNSKIQLQNHKKKQNRYSKSSSLSWLATGNSIKSGWVKLSIYMLREFSTYHSIKKKQNKKQANNEKRKKLNR